MSVQKSLTNRFSKSTIIKALSLPFVFGLALAPIQISLAENADEVFAVHPRLQELPWWKGGGYQVGFVPNGNFTYKVQVIGQKLNGSWNCRQVAAVKIGEIEWDNVKAQLGVSNSDVNANIFGDGEVVRIMGRELGRSREITKTMHFRVVAMGDENRVAYKSNWMPDNAATLTDWSQVPDCNWVND